MKKYIVLIFLSATSFLTYGQMSTGENPYSWNKQDLSLQAPAVVMPKLNVQAMIDEDAKNNELSRFGYSHAVNLNLQNSGKWQTTADGGRLWTMSISSPDALSLNLTYDKFWLPEGGEFYIYSADKSKSLGAFTALNNKGTKEDLKPFATALIQDKEIVLEYYEPKGVVGGVISINKVVSGYRSLEAVTAKTRAVAASTSDEWEKEKRALTLLVSERNVYVGELLNNTNNDNKPYVLIAATYLDPITENSLFYWGTNGSDISDAKSTSGCEILGRSELSGGEDFSVSNAEVRCLLLSLTENPIDLEEFKPYYMGWDSRNVTPALGGVDLNIRLTAWEVNIYDNIQEHQGENFGSVKNFWRIIWSDKRYRANNVLGSPLLNPEHRLVGVFAGGYSYPVSNQKSNLSKSETSETLPVFLKFNIIWKMDMLDAKQANTIRKISYWLSPNSSAPKTLDGMEALCRDISIKNQSIITSRNITGCNITAEGSTTISNNATVNITANESVILKPSFTALNGTTVIIKAIGTQMFSAPSTRATASFEEEATVEKAQAKLYPNPTSGLIYLTEVDNPINKIEVLNMGGKLVEMFTNVTSSFDISAHADGVYLIRIHSNDGVAVHRVILKK